MYIMIHNVKMFKCYSCMGVMYATAMNICLCWLDLMFNLMFFYYQYYDYKIKCIQYIH